MNNVILLESHLLGLCHLIRKQLITEVSPQHQNQDGKIFP